MVVGNIAGEIAVLGERQARAARYENDDSVFTATDTVVNVVDESTVPNSLAAFYVGAADQVFRVEARGGTRRVTVSESPGPAGTTSRHTGER